MRLVRKNKDTDLYITDNIYLFVTLLKTFIT